MASERLLLISENYINLLLIRGVAEDKEELHLYSETEPCIEFPSSVYFIIISVQKESQIYKCINKIHTWIWINL